MRVRKTEIRRSASGPVIGVPEPRRGIVTDATSRHVVVTDNHNQVHIFPNGSINAVPPNHREVGVTGGLKYIRTSSMGGWYFQPD